MEHFNRLTSRQLSISAGSALLMSGAMLSQGTRLGYLPLGLAVLCAVAAYVKFRRR